MPVDIYMPTYKPNAQHLAAAIDSVVAQTHTDWQLWINNQVTDVDVESMIQKYLEDPRIHYNKNTDHPGIGANWNDCLQHGNAPLVQYMFQDDTWEPTYLEKALEVMNAHEDVGILSMGHVYIFEGDIPTENSYHELTQYLAEHYEEGKRDGTQVLLEWLDNGLHPNIIGEPMFVMLRRETIQTVGLFREDMNQNLDSEYWARCLLETNWYYLPGNFGSFRVHEDSASMRNFREGKGLFDRYRMLKDIAKKVPSEEQAAAKEIMQRQTVLMMQKFMKRFGETDREPVPGATPTSYALKNPGAVTKSVMGFVRSKF